MYGIEWDAPLRADVTAAQDPDPPRDRGYTLVELLIAIVLMGTIVLAIMGGMWAVVRASNQNDELAKVQGILGAAGDVITAEDWYPCPADLDVTDDAFGIPGYEQLAQKAAATVGWPTSSVQITKYEIWDPNLDDWVLATGDCNSATGMTTLKTPQKITIEVTSPGGNTTGSIDIVKTDIRAEEVADVTAP